MTRTKTAAALGVAAALVGASAVVAAGSDAAGAATPGRKPLTYRIDKDGHIHGPSHIRPGKVEIKLRGFASEQVQLVKAHSSRDDKAALIHDVGELNSTGKTADLLTHFSLVGGASPHSKLYVSLEKGTYYAVDANSPAAPTDSLIKTIIVAGARKNAKFPKASTITASGEHNWSKKPASIPTDGVLRFANHAHDAHFLSMQKLKKGKTVSDVNKALKGAENPNDVFVSKGKHISFNMATVSPGRGERATYKLSKGTYAVLCFWPDRKTGMPHALMGMVRTIKVG